MLSISKARDVRTDGRADGVQHLMQMSKEGCIIVVIITITNISSNDHQQVSNWLQVCNYPLYNSNKPAAKSNPQIVTERDILHSSIV